MLINKNKFDVDKIDITSEENYINRRKILKLFGISTAIAIAPNALKANEKYSLKTITPENKAKSYNNFYEFGLDKSDPYKNAHTLKTRPWEIKITGEVAKEITLSIDDILRDIPIIQRAYRFRCVEAWSMNIPWNGFELNKLLNKVKIKGNAKFVQFKTKYAPDEMIGQRNSYIGGFIKYPYIEGLRIDEAMHPLTLIATGMYGKDLPNQNGAPLRLIVPWKYGFKSIKSIVEIKLVEKMPTSTWMQLQSEEYGFYANVNPNVSHPRWSQREERFIGGGFFNFKKVPTLMFNGYENEVASMYSRMDLVKNF
ncbi:protein-methionine-sulfoxide reductase catalytic subunit MsrP [Helicobacter sp. 16-1353]|uniref:protein-methionine-sulfoxide reductase catalytic subunit MsrP n=1 Tax=Helicobacter sp. 16-1353 TaxID=2004996 RepID=UPI0015EEDF64|nr:protein-methionine-sulfoxide reductase catalytic subunit MsrP [Helicobacter sp. 16-1353]